MIKNVLETLARAGRKIESGTPEGIIPTDRHGFGNNELSKKLAEEGKPFVIGGLSLVGERGAISYVVGILQWKLPEGFDFDEVGKKANQGEEMRIDIKGWNFHYGGIRQGSGQYRYMDTSRGIKTMLSVPNTMVYFVSEVNPKFVEENADKKRLKKIVEYVLAQIHD